MIDSKQELKEMLVNDLSPLFVRGLIENMHKIYPDSYNKIHNDDLIGEDQENDVVGHYRRAEAESVLMRLGTECGLDVQTVPPKKGGIKHVEVSFERFKLVICHVSGPNSLPKQSDDRIQSAEINKHLFPTQYNFVFGDEVAPKRVEEVCYGIITHCEVYGHKDQLGSLKIGFPDPDYEQWAVKPIELLVIQDIQKKTFEPKEDLQSKIQDDSPKFKNPGIQKKRNE